MAHEEGRHVPPMIPDTIHRNRERMQVLVDENPPRPTYVNPEHGRTSPSFERHWVLLECFINVAFVVLLTVTPWVLCPRDIDKKILASVTGLFICFVALLALLSMARPDKFLQNVLAIFAGLLFFIQLAQAPPDGG
ncbi:hypothetical protein LTR47_009176 [Exophiala xenobiotica]|nr:hypothetical protein LTR41_009867 [Exophiala xenobiotica]KAK5226286.1 hypothetical protein LTR47_009176 [Exophiala xenobiotica]KAK5250430.1 hypothetical protein LTS06_004861 [Exophiala xenobiotica]KAK5279034.1 hypothetical protein LTR40_008357 [Exophiala xenobiotica]KAK5351365.1 hypothetical protein LTR61_004714 [Exophiala xenobiotica]